MLVAALPASWLLGDGVAWPATSLETLLMTDDREAWFVVVAVARSEEMLSRADVRAPWSVVGVGVALLEEPLLALLRFVAAVI